MRGGALRLPRATRICSHPANSIASSASDARNRRARSRRRGIGSCRRARTRGPERGSPPTSATATPATRSPPSGAARCRLLPRRSRAGSRTADSRPRRRSRWRRRDRPVRPFRQWQVVDGDYQCDDRDNGEGVEENRSARFLPRRDAQRHRFPRSRRCRQSPTGPAQSRYWPGSPRPGWSRLR